MSEEQQNANAAIKQYALFYEMTNSQNRSYSDLDDLKLSLMNLLQLKKSSQNSPQIQQQIQE